MANFHQGSAYTRPEHMNVRKNIRRAAEKQHPGQAMQWCGGVLCFLKTGEVVPHTPQVTKPGSIVIGFVACGAQKLPVIPTFNPGAKRREFGDGGFYGYHPTRRTDSGDGSFYDHQAKYPSGNHRTGAYVSGRL